MPAQPAAEPTPEQLDALDALAQALDEDQTTALLGGAEEVVIRVRKGLPGEVWVRAD